MRTPGEGWGLAPLDDDSGPYWLLSNGSATLKILNLRSFRPQRSLMVNEGGIPITRLNELELGKGLIFANVWLTPRIAIIDPATGTVIGWLDLSALYPPESAEDPDNVLNGIAFDGQTGHFFVTGKRWSKMFEIQINDQALLKAKQRLTRQ